MNGPPNHDGLSAKVYVNKNNPRDYFVELRENTVSVEADYDYR
jgi:hypothetical protein